VTGAVSTSVDRDTVERVLNGVVDPCSVTSGCPAGLVDMGLVRRIDIERRPAGISVSVALAVTHPFCAMAAVFVNEARIRLAELEAVDAVDVDLDTSLVWTDELLSPDYAARRQRSLVVRGIMLTSSPEHSHA
jgi:metal-sulfur cluster biosynthetic enzyme